MVTPLSLEAPRLGEQGGASTHHCPGFPQPLAVAPWGAGVSEPVLLHSPPSFRGVVISPSVPGHGSTGRGSILLCMVLLSLLFSLAGAGCVAPGQPPHGGGVGGQ